MRIVNPIEAAFAAGLFDGEGCILSSEYIALYVANTDFRLCKRMCQLFGGRVQISHKGSARRNVLFSWRLQPKEQVLNALRSMLPHLTGKREEALLAIQALEQCPRLVGTPGRHDPMREMRASLFRQIKDLKRQKLALALADCGVATEQDLLESVNAASPKCKPVVMPETRAARAAIRGEKWQEVYGNRRKRRWHRKPIDLSTAPTVNKEPM